jgi:hypothetical protein
VVRKMEPLNILLTCSDWLDTNSTFSYYSNNWLTHWHDRSESVYLGYYWLKIETESNWHVITVRLTARLACI